MRLPNAYRAVSTPRLPAGKAQNPSEPHTGWPDSSAVTGGERRSESEDVAKLEAYLWTCAHDREGVYTASALYVLRMAGRFGGPRTADVSRQCNARGWCRPGTAHRPRVPRMQLHPRRTSHSDNRCSTEVHAPMDQKAKRESASTAHLDKNRTREDGSGDANGDSSSPDCKKQRAAPVVLERCQVCRANIIDARTDARYCSGRCKMVAYWRRRIEREAAS